MNWKRIGFYLFALISVVTILFLGFLAYIAFIPPAQYEPEIPEIADQTQYQLDEKVGWYRMEDNSEWLITWRPHGGLLALNFNDFANNNLIPNEKGRFTWYHDGDSLAVVFRDSAGVVNMFQWADSSGTKHVAKRMNDPYYHQQELSYSNGDVTLKGTLLIPNAQEIQSAAVIIHGSGTSHRDNFWYLYQADYLAKKGVMILLPDKRGSGASDGAWHTASMEDFAGDAIAGMQQITQIYQGDPLKLGFIGFSQGGVVAPLAAQKFSNTDFWIDVSGSAVTFNEQLNFEIYNDVRASGVPRFVAPLVAAAYARRVRARRPVWWEKNGDYSPIPYLTPDIPALFVYGADDTNAPVSASIAKLGKIQDQPGYENLTVKVYEHSGHAIGDPDTGWIREEYLEFMAGWIQDI